MTVKWVVYIWQAGGLYMAGGSSIYGRWMVYGPCDFTPSVEVEIVEKRRSIPLDANEGIYIRDIKDGKVRAVCWCPDMARCAGALHGKVRAVCSCPDMARCAGA